MDKNKKPKYNGAVFFVDNVEKSKTFYTDILSQKIEMDYCPICNQELTYSFENQIERWYCDNYNKYFDRDDRKITP